MDHLHLDSPSSRLKLRYLQSCALDFRYHDVGAGDGLIHAITKFVAEYDGRGETKNLRPIIYYVLKSRLSYCNHHSGSCFSVQKSPIFLSLRRIVPVFLAALGLLPGMVTAILSAAIEVFRNLSISHTQPHPYTTFLYPLKSSFLLWAKG